MSKYLELVEGSFTQEHLDKQTSQKPYVAYSIRDGKAIYTIIPKEEGCNLITLKKVDISNIIYEEVDLGLPSGLKWANKNVGAQTEEDYGTYFSWGNTDGYTVSGTKFLTVDEVCQLVNSILSTSVTNKEELEAALADEGFSVDNLGIVDGYSFDDTTYNGTSGAGFTGNVLGPEHDTATVNMKGDWRMPTRIEILELIQNTDHYYIGEDGSIVAGPFDDTIEHPDKGLDGSKLRSICFVKKGESFDYNDRTNFIEFPFAGSCEGSLVLYKGLSSGVWSSSVHNDLAGFAYNLALSSDGYIGGDSCIHFVGQSVRGVQA